MVDKILKPPHQVRIAVVGKYTELADSYKSIHEALVHGGIANEASVRIEWIASDRFTDQETAGELLADYDGLLVPGGFGVRGVEGMLEAIRWAREHKLPFFGICLGLQTAIIEFARNMCKIPDTNSSEFAPEAGVRGLHWCGTGARETSVARRFSLVKHVWLSGSRLTVARSSSRVRASSSPTTSTCASVRRSPSWRSSSASPSSTRRHTTR